MKYIIVNVNLVHHHGMLLGGLAESIYGPYRIILHDMAQFCIKTLYLVPKQYLVHRIPHCTATAAGLSGVKSVLCIRIPILHMGGYWQVWGKLCILYLASASCIFMWKWV